MQRMGALPLPLAWCKVTISTQHRAKMSGPADPEGPCVCSVFTSHFPATFSLKNSNPWRTITGCLKLCIKWVESRSSWSDVVGVISDEGWQKEVSFGITQHNSRCSWESKHCAAAEGEHPSATCPWRPGTELSCFSPGSSKSFYKVCHKQPRGWPRELALSLAEVK